MRGCSGGVSSDARLLDRLCQAEDGEDEWLDLPAAMSGGDTSWPPPVDEGYETLSSWGRPRVAGVGSLTSLVKLGG